MDEADLAVQRQEDVEALALSAVRNEAAAIVSGHSGGCVMCGEMSQRLMSAAYFRSKGHSAAVAMIEQFEQFELEGEEGRPGICAPCRDKHKLP